MTTKAKISVKLTVDANKFNINWLRIAGDHIKRNLNIGLTIRENGELLIARGLEQVGSDIAALKSYMEKTIANDITNLDELATSQLLTLLEEAKLIEKLEISSTPSDLLV